MTDRETPCAGVIRSRSARGRARAVMHLPTEPMWLVALGMLSTAVLSGCAKSSTVPADAPRVEASAAKDAAPTHETPMHETTMHETTVHENTVPESLTREGIRRTEPEAKTSIEPADSHERTPAEVTVGTLEAPAWIELTPQIRVDRAHGVILCTVVSVLDVGFLEQYVCAAGTREHESLFAFEGKASELHAALLLVGCRPGQPGSWREAPPVEQPTNPPTENHRFVAVPPTGEPLELSIELPDGSRQPLTYFVRASPVGQPANATNQAELRPPRRFVFAGSQFRTDQRTGAERYLADGSGSIVGLVTFGDETIAAEDVIPDQVSAADPVWEAFTERMPKPGTRLTLRIERSRLRPRTARRRLLAPTRGLPADYLRVAAKHAPRARARGVATTVNKKARPRQSLRPSPSGGRMMGRYLPTSIKVTPASDQAKANLAKSLWKVNSLQPVGSAKCARKRSPSSGTTTQVFNISGFMAEMNPPPSHKGDADPKDGPRCIS